MKTIHKFKRQLKAPKQYYACTGKSATFAENVSYFWAKVTCKKCLAKKGAGYGG